MLCSTIQVSQAVTQDYPDLELNTGLEVIAGLLYVPLSAGGRDFIAFLRKGQPREVRWAGRPYKDGEARNVLEPRASFRLWLETVAGRCRLWSDEHLETAGVLALVYGKVGAFAITSNIFFGDATCLSLGFQFIEVWRQKENALQTTKLTNLLLSNASHEGTYLPVSFRRHINSRLSTDATQSYHKVRHFQFAVPVRSYVSYTVILSWLLMVHWILRLARTSASRMLHQK